MADDFFDTEEAEQETQETLSEPDGKVLLRDRVQIRRKLEDKLEDLRLSREFDQSKYYT